MQIEYFISSVMRIPILFAPWSIRNLTRGMPLRALSVCSASKPVIVQVAVMSVVSIACRVYIIPLNDVLTQIPFDENYYLGELEHCDLADAVDVAQNELELLGRLKTRVNVSCHAIYKDTHVQDEKKASLSNLFAVCEGINADHLRRRENVVRCDGGGENCERVGEGDACVEQRVGGGRGG